MDRDDKLNKLSQKVIGCAIEVHKSLGPGLLESAYQACLEYELRENRLYVEKEKSFPVVYREVEIETGYRIDLFITDPLINESLIVELKSVDKFTNIHLAQMLTYLKLSRLKLGLLMNFNVSKLVDGIRRVVN